MDIREALKSSNPSMLQRMLTNEGLSCTTAENSPKAYLLENKILRKVRENISAKDFDIEKKYRKFANESWVHNKLNKLSDIDKLQALLDKAHDMKELIINLRKIK
jgi:hypothetical protein